MPEKSGLPKVQMVPTISTNEYELEWKGNDGESQFIKYLSRGPLYADIRSLARLGIEFFVTRHRVETFKVTVE